MGDEDYAHQALSALERIDVEALEQECRDAHEDAVAAVDELAAALEEDDETDDAVGIEAPEGWDEDDWDEKINEAYEAAEIARSKGTLTTKTIDERGYYYIQWREGEKVKSQYVAPVSST
ncbi:hypothetical protein [Haloarcula sp. Atlit-120R]|uniref:hypothetical protein n=1 Tax=Haloarcula TaxID=2237 RepID=UPI000EF22668|nr:hypothetical protein [Haloarcula sp. Atlit-120R]RLM32773.1 hypothetical protein DVK01_19780 [Haloarcula sp. Atlit-120R]